MAPCSADALQLLIGQIEEADRVVKALTIRPSARMPPECGIKDHASLFFSSDSHDGSLSARFALRGQVDVELWLPMGAGAAGPFVPPLTERSVRNPPLHVSARRRRAQVVNNDLVTALVHIARVFGWAGAPQFTVGLVATSGRHGVDAPRRKDQKRALAAWTANASAGAAVSSGRARSTGRFLPNGRASGRG